MQAIFAIVGNINREPSHSGNAFLDIASQPLFVFNDQHSHRCCS